MAEEIKTNDISIANKEVDFKETNKNEEEENKNTEALSAPGKTNRYQEILNTTTKTSLILISHYFIIFYILGITGGGNNKTRKKSSIGNSPSKSANKFSEEELMKISQAFALSDIATGRTGAISAKEVVNVVRTLGQCPTQIEVQELILEVDLTRRIRTGASVRGGSTKKKGRKKKPDPSTHFMINIIWKNF